MSDRIGIKVEKKNGKLTLIIPPAYKWKSHNSRFWITVILYSIFSVANIWFGLSFGRLGQAYTLCYLLLFMCDRDSAMIIKGIQLLLTLLIFFNLTIEFDSNLMSALSVFPIAEILVLGEFKNSVFREIIWATHICIESPDFYEPSKLYIFKKALFLVQTDFVCKTAADKRTPEIVEILLNNNPDRNSNSIRWLNEVGLRNRSGKHIMDYSLCWLFTKQEKEQLVQKLIAEYKRP